MLFLLFKSQILFFFVHDPRATAPFDMVHKDGWGITPTLSKLGCKYYCLSWVVNLPYIMFQWINAINSSQSIPLDWGHYNLIKIKSQSNYNHTSMFNGMVLLICTRKWYPLTLCSKGVMFLHTQNIDSCVRCCYSTISQSFSLFYFLVIRGQPFFFPIPMIPKF